MQTASGVLHGYLTLHSFGNYILNPWAFRRHSYPDNVADLMTVGHRARDAIKRAGGPVYKVGSTSDLLYEASGTSFDYAKSLGVSYVYTMEMTNTKYQFLLPARRIKREALPAVEGILVVAEAVRMVNSQTRQ